MNTIHKSVQTRAAVCAQGCLCSTVARSKPSTPAGGRPSPSDTATVQRTVPVWTRVRGGARSRPRPVHLPRRPSDACRSVPFRSRFYLGGPTSVRGFSMHSVGPQSEGQSPHTPPHPAASQLREGRVRSNCRRGVSTLHSVCPAAGLGGLLSGGRRSISRAKHTLPACGPAPG